MWGEEGEVEGVTDPHPQKKLSENYISDSVTILKVLLPKL